MFIQHSVEQSVFEGKKLNFRDKRVIPHTWVEFAAATIWTGFANPIISIGSLIVGLFVEHQIQSRIKEVSRKEQKKIQLLVNYA